MSDPIEPASPMPDDGLMMSFTFTQDHAPRERERLVQIITKFNAYVEDAMGEHEGKERRLIEDLLALQKDPTQLKRVAFTLWRVADVVDGVESARRRKAVIDLAAEDPTWFACAFADFSSEIPEGLDPEELTS